MSEQVSFDSLLRMAVRETYLQQTNSIPADDKLDEIIHPSNKFEKKMQVMVRRESLNEKLVYFRKITAKVAVVVLLCISLTFGSLLTAKAVRESVATTILEWHDKFTRIFVETDTATTKLPEIRFNYIPEGFELVEEESFENKSFKLYTYRDSKNRFIRIHTNFHDDNIDNENSSYYCLIINGNEGVWIENQNNRQLVIQKNKLDFSISSDIVLGEIIKIYKNIEIL